MTAPLVLASTSPFRKQLLSNAGLIFDSVAPAIDEREVEGRAEHQGLLPDALALLLGREKALSVSRDRPEALIIGGDQTMSLGARLYHKPANRAAARDQLLSLRGQTHELNSALAFVRDGAVIWEHVSKARLTVRSFSEAWLDDYLDRAGDRVLKSVGAYQIEGLGIQLFSAIEGDYFTIVGVPLLPMLAKLRSLGLIHD
ncbi:Maf family protein [Rhizobium paknamense]|uniref:7-methyl-GTP pyrophosphatase n=1 Tax=Rhizobium paknamense TaxID=1206817 RepID=A0ABU0II95_9HYPH|nr:Maf family protein [Rhizobium paknamense]MDQ0457947.1 septum formation protein [Rhizobium paknamense]